MDKISKKGYVYLLGSWGNDKIYKIGVTRGTIERRIKKLQTGNSNEIYIVDYYQSKYIFHIEKMMHLKYASKNVMNEWFELSVDDILNFKKDCAFYEKLHEEYLNMEKTY